MWLLSYDIHPGHEEHEQFVDNVLTPYARRLHSRLYSLPKDVQNPVVLIFNIAAKLKSSQASQHISSLYCFSANDTQNLTSLLG